MMDPFSIVTASLGTFGVVLQSTQALVQLVSDVRGAPEEVSAASKEAQSFAGVLKNIQDQVDNGTIPKAIADTLQLPLDNCSVEVKNLTDKLKPYISTSSTGRKWTNKLKWAMLEKQSVKGMGERLSQNKLTLLTGISGYTVANTGKQLDELNAQISKLDVDATSRHDAEIISTSAIGKDVKDLDHRLTTVSEETRERDLRLAAEARAHSEQLHATMTAQLEALMASQFAKLQQNFVGVNAAQSCQDEQIVASKTDQIRELIAKVKDDPVFALRNFFEGSTIIENNMSKLSDIADLTTLEDDYVIEEEPDDVGGSGLSVEERVDSYGGWSDPTETLFRAVMAGDKQVVVAILDSGVDVNTVNKNGKTALMLAADDDQKLIAQTLLQHGATIDSADLDGFTALHTACSRGYVTLCVLLLRFGANIEAKTLKGETPLQVAILADRPHIVQLLVKNSCDLKAMGPDGSSILHLVIEEGRLGMLRILIDGGVPINIRDSTTGRTPLHIASFLGNYSVATILLDHYAEPDILDDSLDTAFLISAREGKEDILKLLADGGADINIKNSKGDSALNEAAQRLKSEAVVKTLLTLQGIDINQRNSEMNTPFLSSIASTNLPVLKLLIKVSDTAAVDNLGYTALHIAAYKSTKEVAQILVEHGLNLHALDKYKVTAFHRAVGQSNIAVMEYLLTQGVDVNSTSGESPWTALHYAAKNANVPTIKSLLAHGANIEAVVPKEVSATPLLRAVFWNRISIVQFLINNGANIAHQQFKGYTALHICAWKNAPEICTRLLSQGGINIEALDDTGMTPLMRAANLGNSEAVALILIKHGANTDLKTSTGENALRLFLRSDIKSLELLKLLLEKEPDINAVDRAGLTPLIKVVVFGKAPMVTAVLAKKPNLELTNSSHMSPLNIASWKGFKEIVISLLNAGANINHRCQNGISPLIDAARCGQDDIVRLLIARGADVLAKNKKGQNALDVAVEAKKTSVATILMNTGAFQQPTIQKAVKDNDVPLMELLLMKNPELIEDKDEDGYRPLHLSMFFPANNAALAFLLEKGADLDARTTKGETPLMTAVWKNNRNGASKLIEKSKSLSDGKCPIVLEKGSRGCSPLHYAANWNADTYIIKLLLNNGAEIDAVDDNEVTSLHFAADKGRLETLRVLVASGANIDAKDQTGRTTLMRAIKAGHDSAGRLLIELGANIQEKSYQYSMSALMYAVTWTDSVPLVEALMTAGAIINDDIDSEQCTVVARAAINENSAVFDFLVAQGCKVDVVDIFGQQPLQRATRLSRQKGVRILLDAKADVHFKDKNWGMTALHYAGGTNDKTVVAQLLLDHGADINAKDDAGATPIFKAVNKDKKSMLNFFVEKGADLEVRNNDTLTPLLQAVRWERRDMVSLLLDLGADITAKDLKAGMSVAHHAAVSNNQALIVDDLLKKGVPLEGKDNNGNTPLMRAAINGKEAVLRCLLAKGADLDAMNATSSMTPVLHAIRNCHSAAAMCLLKHGANHNVTEHNGRHGIHMSASAGVKQTLSFYIDKGYIELEMGDPCSPSTRGLRAIHIAVLEGHEECVKVLLASGAGLEHRSFLDGNTPFLLVAEPPYGTKPKTTVTMLSIAKKLSDAGANIFAKDYRGRNALFGAVASGAVELVEFLAEKGLQLDIKDLAGSTLIHAATGCDQTRTLEHLIKRGVDVCVPNNHGRTALHLAVSKCNYAVAKVLVGANASAVDMSDKEGNTAFDEAVKLAAQYDGPEESQPKGRATPKMSREKARQNVKDIVTLFHSIRVTTEGSPPILKLSRRATEPGNPAT